MSIRWSAPKQAASAAAVQLLIRVLPPIYEPDVGWDRHAGVWNAWAKGAVGVVATGRGTSPQAAAQALLTQMREQKLISGSGA